MERENLAGDAKGKGTSGSNREAESTDAPERGGQQRGQVIAIGSGQLATGGTDSQWKAATFVRWHEPYESRGSRAESVRGSG
jgi:hypothetical protein